MNSLSTFSAPQIPLLGHSTGASHPTELEKLVNTPERTNSSQTLLLKVKDGTSEARRALQTFPTIGFFAHKSKKTPAKGSFAKNQLRSCESQKYLNVTSSNFCHLSHLNILPATGLLCTEITANPLPEVTTPIPVTGGF